MDLRPFTVEEKVIEDKFVKAKAEFLGLREDVTSKVDSDLATFLTKSWCGLPDSL
jgi:hypothetical protein